MNKSTDELIRKQGYLDIPGLGRVNTRSYPDIDSDDIETLAELNSVKALFEPKSCNCDSRDLFHCGCKCGSLTHSKD